MTQADKETKELCVNHLVHALTVLCPGLSGPALTVISAILKERLIDISVQLTDGKNFNTLYESSFMSAPIQEPVLNLEITRVLSTSDQVLLARLNPKT